MRALRWTAGGLLALVLCAAAAVGGLWVWSGTEGSLPTALQLAQTWLPRVLNDGQTLVVQDARGALRDGGSVGLLQWRHGAQVVDIHNLQVRWDWRELKAGRLHVPTLKATRLLYQDAPSGSPLVELHLPLPVDVMVDIDTVELPGPPALSLQGVQGHYVYDGTVHRWDLTQVQIAQGTYSAQGTLQAASPMALDTRLRGTVQVAVPGSKSTVDVQAGAHVKGTVSAPDGTLDIDAQLQGAHNTMQASVQAQIKPWQAQPVVQARGTAQGVDLAALWPQAPQTLLGGKLAVEPQGDGWKASATVSNARSGPWDQKRVPVQSATASGAYRGGQWVVDALQANAAGGTVQAQGRYDNNAKAWNLSALLQGVRTEQLDTRLAADVLEGKAEVQQRGADIGFDVQLQGRSGAESTADAPLRARLKSLQAKGRWLAPVLQLDQLQLAAVDATLQGPVTVNTRTREAKGRLQATVPGAQVAVEGAAGIAQGGGTFNVHATDAAALQRWMAWLRVGTAPVDTSGITGSRVQGALDLTGRWSGGWHDGGTAMQVSALLQSERLLITGADAARTVRLSNLRAEAGGTLHAMDLNLQGQADTGTQTFNLQSRARGGWVKEALWSASVDVLQLVLKDSLRAGVWTAQLAQSVALQWQGAGSAGVSSLDIAPGTLRLTGPVPGTAQVQWQAARWWKKAGAEKATGTATAAAPAQWHTQGRMTGVPLAWFEFLGQAQMANLGLRGDLVVGGEWDASFSDHLRVRAGLERTGGDLQLLSQDQTSTLMGAGLREVRVQLQIDDDTAVVKGGWNSESAGSASAEFQTRLDGGASAWAADAPVKASIRANLPRVGVWSLLAPPGWRIQGTLDANLALSGTRANPDWSGTLEARDMAIRSVVEGIDFSKGVLRLRLDGQRMEIAEFTLQGAGAGAAGDAGGLLKATGQVVWLPASAPSQLASRVRMELDAIAQSLRVSARADQRLTVSGRISARLEDARLVLRGALTADQAQFVLPDYSVPQLGDDVVVRPRAGAKPANGSVASGRLANAAGAKSTSTAVADKPRAVALDVDVTLDPGRNFHLKGQGIDTRLEGKLNLRTEGKSNGGPRLNGELHTVGGTYKAYGQTLDIDTGVLRFNGPYDNPALDVLALRPNLQQPVGVQISGTVKLPVVRLYSDPDMADAEKLSWLVLGRASSTSGADYALLQSAALALMAGRGEGPTSGLIKAFGLDEVSLGETNTTNADGSTGTAATTVKVGKRLSRDFYVAYERSIATTLGTFYVFYDLSRRFTLRAESGTTNAIDLIFTTRFD